MRPFRRIWQAVRPWYPFGAAASSQPARAFAADASATAADPPLFPGPARAALVRGLPPTFAAGLKMHAPGEPIDAALAQRQHAAYVSLLRDLVPRVVEIPADDVHPDCVFIEDTAVVSACGVAVVSRPGAPERRGEVGPVAEVLARLMAEGAGGGGGVGSGRGRGPLIRALHFIEPPGLLDGGDVLQVGRHVIVGLSARTNAAGAGQLAAALNGGAGSGGGASDGGAGGGAGGASASSPPPSPPGAPSAAQGGYRVVAVPVAEGLHLKSACTALDDRTLLFSDDAAGRAVALAIEEAAPELAAAAKFVTLPGDPLCANVLVAGRAVVMQGPPAEADGGGGGLAGWAAAAAVLRALCDGRGLALHVVPRLGELAKADGALTCCSIFLA